MLEEFSKIDLPLSSALATNLAEILGKEEIDGNIYRIIRFIGTQNRRPPFLNEITKLTIRPTV